MADLIITTNNEGGGIVEKKRDTWLAIAVLVAMILGSFAKTLVLMLVMGAYVTAWGVAILANLPKVKNVACNRLFGRFSLFVGIPVPLMWIMFLVTTDYGSIYYSFVAEFFKNYILR